VVFYENRSFFSIRQGDNGVGMTREEQKTREFIAGMTRLSEDGRDYIKDLARSLFLAENPTLIPAAQNTAVPADAKNLSRI
jgi:hypothetical protein